MTGVQTCALPIFMLSKFIEHFDIIYTFEPDPINFYCLNQNISTPNVIKFQSCLGNTSETVTVQQLIRPDRPNDTGGVHVSGKGYMPTIVLDNLNLPGCDLIQLDVEGSEMYVLYGARSSIRMHRPLIILETVNGGIQDMLFEEGYEVLKKVGPDTVFKHRDK